MATRVRTHNADLYEQDFYAWAREQATLLRAGRYDELDLEHLTEEVEDWGGSLYRSVRSRVRTIIEHLLKLEHAPTAEPRGLWRDTVHAQRADLEDDLTASLRRRLRSELPKQYLRVAGEPFIYHALRVLAAHPSIERVFVVLAPADATFDDAAARAPRTDRSARRER